jgi:hypothetical protein
MKATTFPPSLAWRDNLIAFWFVAALVTMLGMLHVVLMRGMFADGAFYLLEVIRSHSFQNYDKARLGAQIVYQLPLLGAVAAGADSVKFLARVLTFSLVFPVALLYLGALWKVRANDALFGAFTLIIVVVYQNLNFMGIGEYNFLYALVTFALAILVHDKELTVVDSLLLVACALVGTRAYEAMVFLGPMLFAACVLRAFAPKPTRLVTIALCLAALLFALGSGLALRSIITPRDPGNLDGAIHSLLLVNPQLWLSSMLAAAYAGYVLLRSPAGRLATIAVFVCALVALAVPADWSSPALHYLSRTVGGVALFAIGAVIIVFRFSYLYDRAATIQHRGFAGILVIAPLLALTVSTAPDIHHSLGWKRFLNSLEKEVNTKTGLIPFDVAKISLKKESVYGWSWTYPTMSILTRHGPSHAIIVNPGDGSGWQPFDPADSRSIPDLHGYYWN